MKKTYKIILPKQEFEYEAKNEDEALERFLENIKNNNETSTTWIVDRLEIIQICAICKEVEDNDGRCKCTNKDSYGY